MADEGAKEVTRLNLNAPLGEEPEAEPAVIWQDSSCDMVREDFKMGRVDGRSCFEEQRAGGDWRRQARAEVCATTRWVASLPD